MKNSKKDFIYNKHNKKDTRFNTKGNLYDRVKNILSWVLIGCVLLSLVGSILGTIAFSKDCKTAMAETSYTFYYDNLSFPTAIYNVNTYGFYTGQNTQVQNNTIYLNGTYNNLKDSYNYYNSSQAVSVSNTPLYSIGSRTNQDFFASFDIKITNVPDSIYDTHVRVDFNPYGYNLDGVFSSQQLYMLDEYRAKGFQAFNNNVVFTEQGISGGYPSAALLGESNVYNFLYFNYYGGFISYDVNGNQYIDTNKTLVNVVCRTYLSSLNFNGAIAKIEKGSVLRSEQQENFFMNTVSSWSTGEKFLTQWRVGYNFIRFYDFDSNYVELAFLCGLDDIGENIYFNNETFFTNGTTDGGYSYNEGWKDGIASYKGSLDFKYDAEKAYKSQWIQDFINSSDFYNTAYNRYHSVWFGQGVTSANDYTFFSLVSAPVDAVLQGFFGNGSDDTGLLNFELLGINFKSLFSGLFTLAVILWIVKFVTQQKT